MVKVKSWLFTEVRGKVKKAEFRRRKNKVTELSQKRIPFNPRTPAQREVRRTYGKCVEEWNKLSEAEKREWRIIGTLQGISGYNAFMRDCITKKLGAVWYELLIDNTGNPNALSDFQVLLEVTNDEAFFKDADFKQEALEFYDADKATLLNHYTELWDTLHYNAKIWIKVPYIPANECRFIYLKMNTKRTTDLSNPENVFDFYDNFEGDLSKWIVINGTNYSIEGGTLKATGTFPGGPADVIRTKKLIGKEAIVEYDVKPASDVEIACVIWAKGAADEPLWMVIHRGKNIYYWTGSSWESKASGTNYRNVGEWNKEKIIFTEAGEIKAYTNDNLVVSYTDATPIEGYVGFRKESDSIEYVDNFRVRKYTKPEPTVSYSKI